MKTYSVKLWERVLYLVEIEAEDEEQARELVMNGEGEYTAIDSTMDEIIDIKEEG